MLNLIWSAILWATPLKTEVQVTLCESHSTLHEVMKQEPWQQARQMETFFLENRHLELHQQAWVLRIRLNHAKHQAQITIKKKYPQGEPAFPSQLKKDISCEYDLHADEKNLACKLSTVITLKDFNKAQQENDWQLILSKKQKAWLDKEQLHLPQTLVLVGPYQDVGFSLENRDPKFSLDLSRGPDGQEYAEISLRTENDTEERSIADLFSYIAQAGLTTCSDQKQLITLKKFKAFFGLP